MTHVCASCGESHDGVPFSFAADSPDRYAALSKDDKENRAAISSDQCVIDGKEFYLRTVLEITVQKSDEKFLFGLWVRLHEDDFDEVDRCWLEEGKERLHGPFKGRIANASLVYEDQLNLEVTVRLQPGGLRPTLLVDRRDHPLATAQRDGISLGGAYRIVSLLLHAKGTARA